MLGDLYGEARKLDAAIVTLAEGINLFTPALMAVPAVVAGTTVGLVQSYLKQCDAAGREPVAELLGPVIAQLKRLNVMEEQQ
jgi:hypothetical protein